PFPQVHTRAPGAGPGWNVRGEKALLSPCGPPVPQRCDAGFAAVPPSCESLVLGPEVIRAGPAGPYTAAARVPRIGPPFRRYSDIAGSGSGTARAPGIHWY